MYAGCARGRKARVMGSALDAQAQKTWCHPVILQVLAPARLRGVAQPRAMMERPHSPCLDLPMRFYLASHMPCSLRVWLTPYLRRAKTTAKQVRA